MSHHTWQPTDAGSHLRGRKTADTTPELSLRRALHALGLRYRLRRRIGRFRPDIVFPGSRTVVFLDGCFWHGCPIHGAKQFRGPNAAKWRDKLDANKARDARATEELTADGWQVLRIWECDVRRNVAEPAEAIRSVVQMAAGSGSA